MLKNTIIPFLTLIPFILSGCSEPIEKKSTEVIEVTLDNFVQAESTQYFEKNMRQVPINTWLHQGSMANKDVQNVIRMNQDTMYSIAVIDVSKGATITMPERDIYQSVHVIDLNHMVPAVIYPGESVTLTPADLTIGEYVIAFIRTGAADYTEAGLDEAREAAKRVTIDANSARPFVGVNYDQESLTAIRNKLIDDMNKGKLTQPSKVVGKTFDDVHMPSYLITAAAGWAALPAAHAMYTPMVPGQGSAECSSFTMERPDLDYDKGGFFSVTTYDNTGWIVKNNFALNNRQAEANQDGSYTFHFNCEGKPNNIQVVEGWTGIVRLYKPNSVASIEKYVANLLQNTSVEKVANASAIATDTLEITEQNYTVIETYEALKNIHKLVGENKFFHFRNVTPLDNQTVVRMNRDTLYSGYVTDMSKGGTITIPDTGGRYISVMVVLKDHYINQFFAGAGTYTIKPDEGFGMIVVRTQINSNDPEDAKIVNAIQDSISVRMGSEVKFDPPAYDLEELVKWRQKYAEEAATFPSFDGMQGARDEVDPHMHRLGTGAGWGLLPGQNAQYLPYKHVGGTTECVSATYEIPPFNKPGFFSITMYDKDGWIANDNAILNKNNIVMNDGNTFNVSFGKCSASEKKANHLPTTEGWNFLMRVYEPDIKKLKQYKLPIAK